AKQQNSFRPPLGGLFVVLDITTNGFYVTCAQLTKVLKKQHLLNPLKRLFKQTFIYGLATVMPRVISFFLLPLYTAVFENAAGYGQYTNIYAWIAIFNVFLAYGMETAFFRFYHKSDDRSKVVSTSLISLF